jgi:hypothetical protein
MITMEPRTPIDYASPNTRRPNGQRLSGAWLWLIATALPLSAVSWLIVTMGAGGEPYYGGILKFDAITQVGVGTALIVLWALWSAMIIAFILRRRIHRAASATVIWAAICIFYLGHGVNGYLVDIIIWSSGKAMGSTPAPPTPIPATQVGTPR